MGKKNKLSKKELKEVEQVKGAIESMKSEWGELSASYKSDDEREHMERLLFPYPLTPEEKRQFCAVIAENVRLEKEGNTIISIAGRWQAYNGKQIPYIGDAYINFDMKDVDKRVEPNVNFILKDGEYRDLLIFIGSDATGMTRCFAKSREVGEDYICELNQLYLLAISEEPVTARECSVETYFWLDGYRELKITLDPDARYIKELIAEKVKEEEAEAVEAPNEENEEDFETSD